MNSTTSPVPGADQATAQPTAQPTGTPPEGGRWMWDGQAWQRLPELDAGPAAPDTTTKE